MMKWLHVVSVVIVLLLLSAAPFCCYDSAATIASSKTIIAFRIAFRRAPLASMSCRLSCAKRSLIVLLPLLLRCRGSRQGWHVTAHPPYCDCRTAHQLRGCGSTCRLQVPSALLAPSLPTLPARDRLYQPGRCRTPTTDDTSHTQRA